MEEFKAIQEVISMLNEKKSCNDLELCAMRLEALAVAESALGNDAIPYLVIKCPVFLEKNDNLDDPIQWRTLHEIYVRAMEGGSGGMFPQENFKI